MAADFSRVRLDPLLDYAGVELKQGGVLLDADANELVAVIDRRLRALASDTLGRATVSSTTPDAFRITVSGGMLQIGIGRLYADGLLAECHGAHSDDPTQRVFDDLMAETRFTEPVPYDDQPYLPGAPDLPTSGRHLVYLDVWDREVTHLEEPDLVENAAGVETSSRIQTVWQVRVLEEELGTGVTCGSPDEAVPGWPSTIAPSTGVLTTGTFEVPPGDDPCELPPTGGYRGLENQLYRVEIHDPGQPGAGATFKWSRENASVGSRVRSMISAGELELESLGRDEVLRISTGDWVEIIDDRRELSQAAGEMRQATVDDATNRISFTPDLPAEMLPGGFPDSDFPQAQNLRVRRWDQGGPIFRTDPSGTPVEVQNLDAGGSTGLIDVPAAGTTLLLENGVTVAFDSTGANGLEAGDYWVFAARTSDASVELLERASPRGIHHHFARLAIWDPADAGPPSDCRHHWPPQILGADCSCTRCVTPESHASGQLTIQGAVDQIRDTGGTVCLRTGLYVLSEPVRIAGATSVRIRGQGATSVVISAGGAFVVQGSGGVAIEDLGILSAGIGSASAVSLRSAFGFSLRGLVIAMIANPDFQGAAIALGGVVAGAAINGNLIIAQDGVRTGDPSSDASAGFLVTAALGIEDNIFWCQRRGVTLEGNVAYLYENRIRDNQLIGCRLSGLTALGYTLPGTSMQLADNNLSVFGPAIRCGVDGAWIESNKINVPAQGDNQPFGSGISLVTGPDQTGPDQCQVLANQIRGYPDAGILVDAPVGQLIVKLNIIDGCGNGILMGENASAESAAIENNQLADIHSDRSADRFAALTIGIGVQRTEAVTVSGNRLRAVASDEGAGQGKQLIAGILALSARRLQIDANTITEVGPLADIGAIVAGIMVRSPYEQAAVSRNQVERDARANTAQSNTAWQALVVGDPPVITNETGVASRIPGYVTLRYDPTHTLVISGDRAWIDVASDVLAAPGASARAVSSASVLGNLLIARGRSPAVELWATGEVMLGDNRCELRGSQGVPTVILRAPVALINANRVRGGEVSIQVTDPNALVTAIGNITTGAIQAPLKAVMAPLNLIG